MAEEKKGMFGAAKAKPAAKSKKDDKESVIVPGYEQKIKEYQEIGAQIADLEALYKGLRNELGDLGKEKFLELYKRDNANPNTFLIKDGDGCFMFLPMDKYIGLDEERADRLKAEYGDIITKDEKYYFNGAVLERNMETIETLLMGSPDITDADKESLIQKDVKYSIKKGTIDNLAKYGDKMSTVIDEIQIQFQVKTCGGKMADGGDVEEEDIIYDTRADDYYFKNKNSDLEAAIAKWEAEEADKYMSGGGSIIRANNSPLLKYANFEDNWHINLLELNPYRNNQSGLRYKGGNKYGVTRVSPKSGQEVFEFKTLEDAENKFNKLVELSKTFSPIRFEGKTPRYPQYAGGGGVEGVKEDYSHKVGDRITDGDRSGDIVEVKNNGTRVVKINYANGPIKPELINVDEDDIEYWTVLYAKGGGMYAGGGGVEGEKKTQNYKIGGLMLEEGDYDSLKSLAEKMVIGNDQISKDKYLKALEKINDRGKEYFALGYDTPGKGYAYSHNDAILKASKVWKDFDVSVIVVEILGNFAQVYDIVKKDIGYKEFRSFDQSYKRYIVMTSPPVLGGDRFEEGGTPLYAGGGSPESDFKYAGGGSTVGFNPMGNSYLLYEGQSILLKTVPSPKESRFLDKEIVIEKIDNNKILKAFVRETGEKVPFFIDSNLFKIEQYAEGGGLNSFQSLLKKYNG